MPRSSPFRSCRGSAVLIRWSPPSSVTPTPIRCAVRRAAPWSATASIGPSEPRSSSPSPPARPPSSADPRLSLRCDDEAEAGVRPIVAREHLLDLLSREALVLGGGVEQIIELEASVVERGQTTQPEVGRLHHLLE